MTYSHRQNRVLSAFLGAVEAVALLISLIVFLSIGGNGINKLLSALAFMFLLPVAIAIGILLGIVSVKCASSWSFARPRQVIISIIISALLLVIDNYFYKMELIKRPKTLEDTFVSASTEHLIKSLNDPQPGNRLRAAEELAKRQYPSAGELILPLHEDMSGHVRSRATALLGHLRYGLAVDRIVSLLDDPDFGVQLDAVRSLGRIGDSRAVEPLLAVINRPYFSGLVAEALANIGDQKAIGPLIDFLENTTQEDVIKHQKWLINSLERLSGQKYGNNINRWRKWYDSEQ